MLISTITKKDALLENQIYLDFHRVGKILIERRLGDQEIQDLFKAVEKGFSDSGQNRTMIGRGKDVATDVGSFIADAYRGVADKISKSGPVSAFDVTADKLTDKIKSAAGGDSRIMQAIYKYRDFAKRHPKMQGAILAGMIALAGISGAGLGGAALIGGIRTFDSLLKGNKASSALWQGFLAGTLAYGAGQIGQALSAGPGVTGQGGPAYEPDVSGQGGPDYEPAARSRPGSGGGSTAPTTPTTPTSPAPNVPAPDTAPGPGTGGQGGPNIEPVAAPERPLPPNLRGEVGTGTGGTVTTSSGQPVMTTNYAGLDQATYNRALQGLSPEQLARLGNADPTDPFIRSRLGLPALKETRKIQPLPLRAIIDRDMTLLGWQLNESLDRERGGLQFNRRGIDHVFSLIEQQLAELDVKGARAQDVLARRGKASQRAPAQTITQPSTVASPASPAAAQTTAGEPPEYLRPTRPGAPVSQPATPGIMSRIGQGLQTFGRQLTTKVTAEKLNTNWKVAGSPTDSDQLYDFLIKQGVPQEVTNKVWTDLKLTIPSGAATATTGASPVAATGDIKMTADDIVAQIKAVWDKITANQANPIGAPAVKNLLKNMWMQSGGTQAKESRERQERQMIDRVIREARHKQRKQIERQERRA